MSLYKLAAYSLEKESSVRGAIVKEINGKFHLLTPEGHLLDIEKHLINKAMKPGYIGDASRKHLMGVLKHDKVKLPQNFDINKLEHTPVSHDVLTREHAVLQYGNKAHRLMADPQNREKATNVLKNYLDKYKGQESLQKVMDKKTYNNHVHEVETGRYTNYYGTEHLQKQPQIKRGPNEAKRNTFDDGRWVG